MSRIARGSTSSPRAICDKLTTSDLRQAHHERSATSSPRAICDKLTTSDLRHAHHERYVTCSPRAICLELATLALALATAWPASSRSEQTRPTRCRHPCPSP